MGPAFSRMARAAALLTACALVGWWPRDVRSAAPPPARTWAVVVGVGAQVDPAIPETTNAPADARALRDLLTTVGGLDQEQVLLLSDEGQRYLDPLRPKAHTLPTRRNLWVALSVWLKERVRAADRVLFYFAGQAATGEGGAPLLLPSDAVARTLTRTSINAKEVARELAKLPGRAVLCIYDTSFSGRGKRWRQQRVGKVSARSLVPGGRGVLWLAAGPREVAREAEGVPHGSFTRALLEALRGGDGRFSTAWDSLAAGVDGVRPLAVGRVDPAFAVSRRPVGRAKRPTLVLQSAHAQPALSGAFSPNGKLFASGGMDGLVKLWDTSTGRVRATLFGHGLFVVALAFSPDGKTLASLDAHAGLFLWDTRTATRRRVLSRHNASFRGRPEDAFVVFSGNGDFVTAGSASLRPTTWRTSSGASLELEGSVASARVAWGPRGAIASHGRDGALLIWQHPRGKGSGGPRVLKPRRLSDSAGAAVRGLAFVAGGRLLAVARAVPDQRYSLALRDTASGRRTRWLVQDEPGRLEGLFASPDGERLAVATDRSVDLWDVRAEKRVSRTTPGVRRSDARLKDGMAFTQGGDAIVMLSPNRSVRSVRRLKLEPGGQPEVLVPAPHGPGWRFMELSADGKRLATWGRAEAPVIREATTGKARRTLEGAVARPGAVAFAPDRRHLAMLTAAGVHTWDLQRGRRRTSPLAVEANKNVAELVYGGYLAFAPDSRRAAIRLGSDVALVWDQVKGKVLRRIPHDVAVTGAALSPNGRKLALRDASGRVSLFDAKTGKLDRRLSLYAGARPKHRAARAQGLAFSPDGKRLATAGDDGQVKSWEVATGKVRATLKMGDGVLPGDLAWSPSGRTLVVGTTGADGAAAEVLRFWDAKSERPYALGKTGVSDAVRFVHSADSKHLAHTSLTSGEIALWDLGRAEVSQRFNRDSAVVVGLAFSRDGRLLAACGLDGTIKLFQVPNGQLVATIAAVSGKDWAVTTPHGLFDGTPGALKLLEWRLGDRLYALDQFFNEFHEPGLLARLIAGERPAPRIDLGRILPPPEVTLLSPKQGASMRQGKVTLRVLVKDVGGGRTPLWIYHNGHRLPTSRGAVAPGGRAETREVQLVEGLNHFRVTAFNRDLSAESRGDEVTVRWDVPPAQRPTLHLVAVGIDHYQAGERLKLSFAEADAKAVSEGFEEGLFGRINRHLLVNEQASKDKLLKLLGDVAAASQPRDTVLLYLAGHGALVGRVFYFLPWEVDVSSDASLRNSALSQVELGEALTRIPATKQIVVLDACHSGASAKVLGRILASRDAVGLIRAQRRLARASGTVLIAASTAAQYAKEIPELGHGVLTYALLSGLGLAGAAPGAAVNKDGQVTVNALLAYLDDQVPRLTEKHHGGRQNPVQATTGQDFPLTLGRSN